MQAIPLSAIATIILLIVIVFIDFTFRREVYSRSDPLSLSLLFYSFLLIVADVLLTVLRRFSAGTFHFEARFLISSTIYLTGALIVFLLVKASHMQVRYAQEKAVKDYLTSLSAITHAPKAVWRALEVLGAETIEPDLFRKNPAKEAKRIEYLVLVRQLTEAQIDPILDQEKLLVKSSSVRLTARLAYVSAFLFAVISTLLFFLQR